MSEAVTETVHATCVAIGGRGVLIAGRSGSGKSDLALRLLDRGAELVSDDYTAVTRAGDRLIAGPAANIAGLIEVRGIGIVPWPALDQAEIGLVIDLEQEPERMPEPQLRAVAGLSVPAIGLAALEPSAPLKAELAARRLWRRAR